MRKLYRVYFNRANEAPQIWSLDEGTQVSEINVSKAIFRNTEVETGQDLAETVNRDRPKAWVQGHGELYVEAGVAIIDGDPIGHAE
jgi:hypothetical protein